MTREQASSVTPGLTRLYTQAQERGYFIQEFTDPNGRSIATVGNLFSFEKLGLTPPASLKDYHFDISLSGTGSTRGAAVRRAMVAWEHILVKKPQIKH